MVTRTVLQTQRVDRNINLFRALPAFHVSRLPTRSIRHARQVPLGPDAIFAWPDAAAGGECDVPDQRIEVAEFRCTSRNCGHQVYAEYADQLKKLDLPTTSRVEVRQAFTAKPDDRLTLDCVAILKSGVGISFAAAKAWVVLVDLETHATELLFAKTVGGRCRSTSRRVASRGREAITWTARSAGEYELRTVTFVDPACPGAEAHLLIDGTQITRATAASELVLTSLSCVGRVA